MEARFTVPGQPRGKARHRTARLRSGALRTYTPAATVRYEALVASEYRRQCGSLRFPDGAALEVRIDAHFAIPASAGKRRRGQMELGELLPAKKPDADNILKCVCDALNGVAYRDDAAVVDAYVSKRYSAQPRTEVTIRAAVL